MTIHKFLIIFVSSVLLMGCDSEKQIGVTPEQAVYESLFLKVTTNTHTKYSLGEITESKWFTDNPFNAEEWEKSLKELGNINIALVKKLYLVNKTSGPINWQPLITNATILPSEFVEGVSARSTSDRCFVNESDANINIISNGKSFRSYYTVSRVAFSENRKKALVKVSYQCAPMSGGGEFFISFEFKEKQWKMIGGRTLWIS
jgi:hypothetical protein